MSDSLKYLISKLKTEMAILNNIYEHINTLSKESLKEMEILEKKIECLKEPESK